MRAFVHARKCEKITRNYNPKPCTLPSKKIALYERCTGHVMSALPANQHAAYISKPPHQKGFTPHANECFGVGARCRSCEERY